MQVERSQIVMRSSMRDMLPPNVKGVSHLRLQPRLQWAKMWGMQSQRQSARSANMCGKCVGNCSTHSRMIQSVYRCVALPVLL